MKSLKLIHNKNGKGSKEVLLSLLALVILAQGGTYITSFIFKKLNDPRYHFCENDKSQIKSDLAELKKDLLFMNQELYSNDEFNRHWDRFEAKAKSGDIMISLNSLFKDLELDHASAISISSRDLNQPQESAIKWDHMLTVENGKIPVVEINSFPSYFRYEAAITTFITELQKKIKENNFIIIKLGGEGGDLETLGSLISSFYKTSDEGPYFPLPIKEYLTLSHDKVQTLRKRYYEYRYRSKFIDEQTYKRAQEVFSDKNQDHGNHLIGNYFLDYDKKSATVLNPNLNVFVVSDKDCSSACEIFLLALKTQLNAIHLGQKSRGEMYYANPGAIILENACLAIQLPTARISYKSSVDLSGASLAQGIVPDVISDAPMSLIRAWLEEKKYPLSKWQKPSVINQINSF